MELYQLTSFLKIARLNNLTKAAEHLHISQSALSSQIRQLEDELCVKLFERGSRGMTLTEEGRILHTHAAEVVAGAETMLARARELHGRKFGTVRIGLNTDGSFLRAGRLSRSLRANFPDADVVFVSSQTIRTPQMLRQGLIDLGFFFGDCLDGAIESEILHTTAIRIVVPNSLLPPGSILSWQTAAALPWIWSVTDCPYYRVVQDELDSRGLEPLKVVDAMDESVIKELVLDDQGLAILREDEARTLAGTGRVWIWDEVRFPVPLRLGSLKTGGTNTLTRAVSAAIVEIWKSDVA